MSRATVIAVTLVAISTIASAQGQTEPPDPTSASTPHQHAATETHWGENAAGSGDGIGRIDPATFVTRAAQGGLTEVAVSRAAATNARDAKVKQFAERMVQDHSKANDELASLAKSKGLQVPTALDAEHQAIVQKLTRKTGAELDAAYAKQMQEDHAKTVALFQAATKLSDPELAAFAKQTLPTLQEHKHMAGELPGGMHTAEVGDKTHAQ